MSKARDLGNLLDTGGDVVSGSLDNVTVDNSKISGMDASKLTGSIANARIPAGAVTQHVTATDLTPVHQSIATLGLHMGVSANAAAFNLPNAFIDTFEDDSGITTETDVGRDATGEYVASVYVATTVTTPSSASDWAGAISGETFNYGRVYFSGGGDESIRSASTISGDFEYQVTVTEGTSSGGWVGVFLASQVGTFNQSRESGLLKNMNDSYQFASIARAGVSAGFTQRTGGSQVVAGYSSSNGQVVKIVRVGSTITKYLDGVLKATKTGVNTGAMYAHLGGGGYSHSIESDYTSITWTTTTSAANATGTLISDTQTAPAATTEVSGVILYKDNAGTATLGTHLKIYFTADNGSNWTEAASYGTAQTFSGTTKQVKLGKTTVTSGTQVKLKAVWASQASGSMETQLHGWAVNY
jgi:hypothetical protein